MASILAHCCKVIHQRRTFSGRVCDLIASAARLHHRMHPNEDFRLDLCCWLEFAGKV